MANKQTKCEYCNNSKSIISFERTYEDGYTGVDHYKNGHCYIKDNSLILSCDIEVTYIDESEKIKFCPMCGRKL